MTPTPGEIYLAYQDKRRPVVVISREELNRGDYLVVIPLTTAKWETRQWLPNCVLLEANKHRLPKTCIAQTEMISFVPKADLGLLDGPVTTLDDDTMRNLVRAVGYVMVADCEPC
jgi:mRNA-degrading endonuclease toxin of MazEF toxin-antitoxin module